jgi:hypothetical protein
MKSGSVLRARTLRRLRPPHQLRQLGDVGGDGDFGPVTVKLSTQYLATQLLATPTITQRSARSQPAHRRLPVDYQNNKSRWVFSPR